MYILLYFIDCGIVYVCSRCGSGVGGCVYVGLGKGFWLCCRGLRVGGFRGGCFLGIIRINYLVLS